MTNKFLTDKGKFMELMADFGLNLAEKPCDCDGAVSEIVIDEMENENDKFNGYSGFYARFLFDKEGKFIKMGVFE